MFTTCGKGESGGFQRAHWVHSARQAGSVVCEGGTPALPGGHLLFKEAPSVGWDEQAERMLNSGDDRLGILSGLERSSREQGPSLSRGWLVGTVLGMVGLKPRPAQPDSWGPCLPAGLDLAQHKAGTMGTMLAPEIRVRNFTDQAPHRTLERFFQVIRCTWEPGSEAGMATSGGQHRLSQA